MSSRRDLLQDALSAIERLQAQLRASERARHEPIAVVSAACRFPGGADTPAALWCNLRDGIDAISEVPRERWDPDAFYDPDPHAPAKATSKWGGFLRDIDRFDADFFGISPREADVIDPQQRLLLEVSLEALERAGLAVDRLVGSRTGVYIGLSTSDYGQIMGVGHCAAGDIRSVTGTALNAAAGRIAFNFGFQGPCVAIDTACSSSAVAIHLACQALRAHECNLALAGAANIMLLPGLIVLLSKWGALSPTGRCRTFDASADGFVRAEGCAVIALKRLSDAMKADDPILAIIRGSAVNSDGRSSGLTVPNGLAQQAVLREALTNADLGPLDIDYVEAHGTGTPIGDAIEVEALGAVFGEGRQADQPLRIGSIKTNIGHGETTAGIAGVLKVILSLQHDAIPPHLHVVHPNPAIPWESLPIAVPRTLQAWPHSDRPRRAGISSFGFSGTNAHIVMEEAPRPAAGSGAFSTLPRVVTLSAKRSSGVQALAGRYAAFLRNDGSGVDVADLSRTTTLGRAAYGHRASFVAASIAEAIDALDAIADSRAEVGISAGRVAVAHRPKVAFVFPGQGSQWGGMALELSAREPVVAEALRACEAAVANELDIPLRVLLARADLLHETRYTQPALFAVEWALSEYWRSLDVRPVAVLGHSVGEYVAACVAGVMSMEDAVRLVAARGRLMQELAAPGAMLAVLADEACVAAHVSAQGAGLDIAAINGPDSVVVAGTLQDIASFEELLGKLGLRTQRLAVSRAFHSRHMERALEAFSDIAAGIRLRAPALPVYANLTGASAVADMTSTDYWVRQAREPVRFYDGMRALLQTSSVVLEVGPGATLTGLARRWSPHKVCWVTTLQRGRAEERSVADAVAQLWSSGVPISLEHYQSRRGGRMIAIPTYPFERERYWTQTTFALDARSATSSAAAQPLEPAGTNIESDLRSAEAAPPPPHSELLYCLEWHPTPRQPQPAPSGRTVWLILGDQQGVADALSERFRARGEPCVVVRRDSEVDVQRLLAGAPTHIVHCWGLDLESAADLTSTALLQAQRTACGSLLELVQTIARNHATSPARLTVLTRGGTVAGSGRAMALAAAPVIGLGRAIAMEYPQVGCACIDLDPNELDIELICAELGNRDREDLVALRAGERLVARLNRAPAPRRPSTEVIDPDSTYLITGGLGALGLSVARSFADRGARHLLLLGRSAPSADAVKVLADLAASGVTARVVQVDVADEDRLRAALEAVSSTMPPLRGIVHAAGVLDDGVVEQQSWERFERVLRPKLAGAWNLHRLTEQLPLDFFVMFSSGAVMLGSPGQSNYIAANAFLDALAHYRQGRGQPALSIAWGGWARAGMATVAHSRMHSSRRGIVLLEPQEALAVLHALLRDPRANVGVLDLRWRELLERYPPGRIPPIFDLLSGRAESRPVSTAALSERLSTSQPGGEEGIIVEYVRECLGAVLGRRANQIDPDTPLLHLGLDSLMAIELRNRIEGTGGPSIAIAHYLDGADVRHIARLIRDRLLSETSARAAPLDDAALVRLVSSMSEAQIEEYLARMRGEAAS